MADGSFHYFRSSGKPFFDAAGNFLGYRGTGADVTAQRRADDALAAAREELRDSEIKYRSIASHIPGAVYRTSGGPNSRELFLGEQIEGICGYSAKELLAGPITCMTVLHPTIGRWSTGDGRRDSGPAALRRRLPDHPPRWLHPLAPGQGASGVRRRRPAALPRRRGLRCHRTQAEFEADLAAKSAALAKSEGRRERWSPTFPASSIAASSMPIGPTSTSATTARR
jgi:PAS domain-containing protein